MHLRENGFNVVVKDLSDQELAALKDQHAIPSQYRSCHTAEIDGYFVEGHVPADVIYEMLATRPEIRGLALPGMPAGSPGMDGVKLGPLEILAFSPSNEIALYAAR